MGQPIPCKSILVIEDEIDIRNAIQAALEMEGYRVFTAGNGREGLEILPKIPIPCLILLDLMMPIMDGWEFSKVVSSDTVLATIPVVVVTAFSERVGTVCARQIIKKPIQIDALFKTVAEYCGVASSSGSALNYG